MEFECLRNRAFTFSGVVFAFVFLSSWVVAAEEKNGFDAPKAFLGRLVSLQIKDGRLRLDPEGWRVDEKTAAEIKKQIKARRANEEVNIWGVGMPSRAKIGETPPVIKRFEEFVAMASRSKGESVISDQSGSVHRSSFEAENLRGLLRWDAGENGLELKLNETGNAGRLLALDTFPMGRGLLIRLNEPKKKRFVLFLSHPDGSVFLYTRRGEQQHTFTAKSFKALVFEHADKVQIFFLRPLADLGISPGFDRLLPPVMALATTGFSAPPNPIRTQADQLLKDLGDEDQQVREKASLGLIRLFPLASHYISAALTNAKEMEVRLRIKRAIAAHPTMAECRAFVVREQLHEDRGYLLELLEHAPFFKAAARARLTVLYGKDHGEKAADWPHAKIQK